MTKIYLHGILGKIFGKCFELQINNCQSAVRAIDANRSGFFKKMMDLNKLNQNYYIIIDGQIIEDEIEFIEKKNIKTIDFVPAIQGAGQVIAAALFTSTAAQAVAAFLINSAITAGISFGVSLISAQMNKQASPPQQMTAVGGAVMASEAKGRSYIFNNYSNLLAQGTSVPVGYGKMRTASRVIYSSLKSYSTSYTFDQISSSSDLNLISPI